MIANVMDGARARFWAGLGGARRTELARAARVGSAPRRRAGRAARAAWRATGSRATSSRRELAARLNDDDEADVARWWDHLRAGDLYLACACARGVDGALERFERLYGDEIARTAQRFERPGLPADDLMQLLRAKLFTMPGGGGARAPTRGRASRRTPARGSCRTGCASPRRARSSTAAAATTEPPEVPMRNELVAVLPEPKGDPELQLLKREHVTHFKASFAEAVAALDSADRLLLKQHLVERLTIDQLGALYHLHRASAARRIAKARDALLVGDAHRAGAAARAAARAAGQRPRAGREPAGSEHRAAARDDLERVEVTARRRRPPARPTRSFTRLLEGTLSDAERAGAAGARRRLRRPAAARWRSWRAR